MSMGGLYLPKNEVVNVCSVVNVVG